MHHTWSIICTDSTIDKDTNQISLFKAVEGLNFTVDPEEEVEARQQHGHLPIPFTFVLVSMWWRSDINKPETGKSRIVMVTPNGEEKELAEAPVDLTDHTRTRIIGRFQGFPFFESGIYHIVVQMEQDNSWQTVAEIPLEIIQQQPIT